MEINKNLGGDRLGSGAKMNVKMHDYSRSTHDLGYIWRSTMSAGTLVPFCCKLMLPGDTWDINLNAEVLTKPTIGPLFGSYKVQLDMFIVPIRLYNSLLHNNALGVGMNISQIKFPQMQLQAFPFKEGKEQINPSCLLAYLGTRGIGKSNSTQLRNFNAIPLLGYWDIYKNYYANKQEEIGGIVKPTIPTTILEIVTPDVAIWPKYPLVGNVAVNVGAQVALFYQGQRPNLSDITFKTTGGATLNMSILTVVTESPGTINFINSRDGFNVVNWDYKTSTGIEVVPFDLNNIDRMREELLAFHSRVVSFKTNSQDYLPYSFIEENFEDGQAIEFSQTGLAVKTYQSDLFNNWLSTEWVDGINGISEITKVSTAGDGFTIDALNLAQKVYNMLNRIAVSGGSYDDWVQAVYAHKSFSRAESPIYIGGLSKELIFQEVVSTAATQEQVLGTLAGRGRMSNKHKGGDITARTDEPAYLMGIVSLTPRVDYSQGNDWTVNLETLDDLHKPALGGIGFQELITEQLAWWDTEFKDGIWQQKSAGKQPAWINYMTDINRTYGDFAIPDNSMFMTLNRRYEYDPLEGIKDLTTYIDPAKFNFIFADTSIDAQNFWVQLGVDITARRKMSAKIIPNL